MYVAEIWFTHSMDRVLKNRSEFKDTQMKFVSGKGAVISFQIILRAIEDDITIDNVSVLDLINENGNVILTGENVEIFREHYITTKGKSGVLYKPNQEMPTMEIPDALIPLLDYKSKKRLRGNRFDALPYTIKSGECQPFWVDVYVPRDIKSGIYKGIVEVHFNCKVEKREVEIKIWDFEMPKVKHQKQTFLIWDEKNFDVAFEAARNNIFTCCYADAKQEETLQAKFGFNVTQTGLWSKKEDLSDVPTLQQLEEIKSNHLKTLPLITYTADEITGQSHKYEGIRKWSRVLNKAGIKQLITMIPQNDLMDNGEGKPAVDIWCVLGNQFAENYSNMKMAMDNGCEIWIYAGLVQDNYTPKWQLDYDLINFRIIQGFINYSIGASGFLYWAIDYWSRIKDPWESVAVQYKTGVFYDEFGVLINQDITKDKKGIEELLFFHGDGILFYPGKDVGMNCIIPSVRVKTIRDGFYDYEMCKILEDLGFDEDAKKYSKMIGEDFYNWTKSPEQLLSVREIIGNKIENIRRNMQ